MRRWIWHTAARSIMSNDRNGEPIDQINWRMGAKEEKQGERRGEGESRERMSEKPVANELQIAQVQLIFSHAIRAWHNTLCAMWREHKQMKFIVFILFSLGFHRKILRSMRQWLKINRLFWVRWAKRTATDDDWNTADPKRSQTERQIIHTSMNLARVHRTHENARAHTSGPLGSVNIINKLDVGRW